MVLPEGYPYAPSELRALPELGEVPESIERHLRLLASRCLPDGSPFVSGWGAMSAAVSEAHAILDREV